MSFKPGAAPNQIAQALRSLGITREQAQDFNLGIKKAYRRLAKTHHPDHFATESKLAAKAHEESFKRAKAAYELLLAEHVAGRWPPEPAILSTSGGMAFAFSNFDASHQKNSPEAAQARSNPPHAPRARSDIQAASNNAFESLAAQMQKAAESGRPKDAAGACADQMMGFFGGPAGFSIHLRMARKSFLESFWSRRTPGLSEAADACAQLLRSRGLPELAACLDPRELSLSEDGSTKFDLASAIAASAPAGRCLDAQEARYYREMNRHWPDGPGPEALACKGSGPGLGLRPLMAELLERCPQAAEGMAGLCDPERMANPFWVKAATASKASARMLAPVLRDASLDDILLASSQAGEDRRAEWLAVLSGRIMASSRADLAAQCCDIGSEPLRELARSWRALASLEERAAWIPSLAGRAMSYAYDPGVELSRQALALAFSGDHEAMASKLALAASMGVDASKPSGFPLASALALRAALRPDLAQSCEQALACLRAVLGEGAMAQRDPLGADAASWLAKARTSSGPNRRG